ncbi:hypothetical protein Ahy_A09g045291 [Arachis hypogaea]|uniref:Uncharacterized protein n=1 Tax=Arachis hypogaea TaxID=3818 RepID=A0A445BLZ5_ARAHY|nr:hypothetical protein Ahy_A09g045291 [Arachis hypogaea]
MRGFKRFHLVNKTNKASPRSSKYTGGLTTFMKKKSRLSRSLEREATLVENFKYSHTLKANKERFADERSAARYAIAHEDYTQRLKVATQQSYLSRDDPGSNASVVDPDRVWCETVSEPYKNHVYGLGLFFFSDLHTSTLAASFASASATSLADLEEVVDLRKEVQKLTGELHQQTQQSRQRYNELLARVKDTDAIRSKLMEKLKLLEHL